MLMDHRFPSTRSRLVTGVLLDRPESCLTMVLVVASPSSLQAVRERPGVQGARIGIRPLLVRTAICGNSRRRNQLPMLVGSDRSARCVGTVDHTDDPGCTCPPTYFCHRHNNGRRRCDVAEQDYSCAGSDTTPDLFDKLFGCRYR